MTRRALDSVQLPNTCSLLDVLTVIDRSGLGIALLVAGDGVLDGIMTDGDVRRALLAGAGLHDAARPYATVSPQTVPMGSARAQVLDLMRALRIVAVPELDERRRVVGLHTLSDVVGVSPLPNPAVIMAGGRGTRLGALTKDTPKPLLEVAGRTILEWIVLNLVGGGVKDVYVSVNHLAEQVEAHLRDGAHLGCRVTYLREDTDRPLGTAGSLGLLRAQRPELDVPLVVMNGDLMMQFEPEHLLDFHGRRAAAITVAARPYRHEVPFGVIRTEDGRVTGIQEKPTMSLDVNAGVYAVSPHVLDLVERGAECTMPQLIQRCLDRGETVAAWPMTADWIDVGTPADLARAKGHA